MKVNDLIHGFRVTRMRYSEELCGKLWEMTYEKTGTELVWMDNGENNKLFSIAFKTLPSDDTGVFHILEHSVLNGSDKYPVKEPFVELLKSSMNTFLNAMTFPDKTLYPVSSRNEQDFLNLTSVYLDAVFCPAIYHNPCIFWQEGGHYELDENGKASYKGVVFNEMKGAFSSSDTLVANAMSRLLFPDNCYRYVSGGDPKHIPDLTYEQFLDAHREYYHPSNAKIYLDGAVPLEKVLEMLEAYLCRYEKAEKTHCISMQRQIPATQEVAYYGIGEDEDAAFMTHISIGKVVCDWSDSKTVMALALLGNYLTGTNESPLKRAILESALAQDVAISIIDDVAQPYCTVDIRNTEAENCQPIKKLLKETLLDLTATGLDRAELNASLNQLEFRVLQVEEPKGLMRNITALSAWLYGGDPLLHMQCRELFAELRREIGTGYYEALLQKVFLDEDNRAEVILLPSATKGREEHQEETARLHKAENAWTDAEREQIRQLNDDLRVWQNKTDAPEELACLPRLPLSEIASMPLPMETEVYTVENTTVLLHKIPDNGILHMNLYFSLADCPFEDLSAISFMTNLLGELPTKRHTAAQLQQLIRENIGELDYNLTAYPHKEDNTLCRVFFTVSCSVLEDRMAAVIKILTEILRDTVFTGVESAFAIESILMQGEDGVRQAIIMDGQRFAGMRASSHFTAAAAVREIAEGFTFYTWLRNFSEHIDEKIEAFQMLAETAANRIFRSQRMTLSMTGHSRSEEAEQIIPMLAGEKIDLAEFMAVPVDGVAAKEWIQIPAGISYAVSAGLLSTQARVYDGGLSVLGNILSLDYLWNEIRVQGGAYGCGFRVSETGSTMFYSYRDPAPADSLKIFADTAGYIRSFCSSEQVIDPYIISSVAATEPLRTCAQEGLVADSDYFCGITYAQRCRFREQMRNLKTKDLLSYCDLFDALSSSSAYCVVGGEEAIQPKTEDWLIYTL